MRRRRRPRPARARARPRCRRRRRPRSSSRRRRRFPGIAHTNSRPPRLGGAGAMEADGERRAAAGERAGPSSTCADASSPPSLRARPRIALVGGEQVGAEPDRGHRELLLARPGEHLHELLHRFRGSRAGAQARPCRASCTSRAARLPGGSPQPLLDQAAAPSRRRPAPIVRTRSPGRASDATNAAAAAELRRPADAHARPRPRRAGRRRACRVTPAMGSSRAG